MKSLILMLCYHLAYDDLGKNFVGSLWDSGGFHRASPMSTCVKAPPMVGPTWTRVRLTLGSDCFPALFQGTALSLPRALGTVYFFIFFEFHLHARWGTEPYVALL